MRFGTLLSAQELIPNTLKYKDSSVPNASGRSGNAAIEARALLGKDALTQLEVTTGSLEATAAAPGNIDKVKLKLVNTDYTNSWSGLSGGGYFTTTQDGLPHRAAIELTASVSGIDPRVDVVTVQETVKRRPDLSVEILPMSQALPNVTFNIEAVVRELNGDV